MKNSFSSSDILNSYGNNNGKLVNLSVFDGMDNRTKRSEMLTRSHMIEDKPTK